MSIQDSPIDNIQQLSINALLEDFRNEVGTTKYVEATGSSKACRDLPVFALISDMGDVVTRVFVYRHGGYADEPYRVEVLDDHTDRTTERRHTMNGAMVDDFIDRLLMRADYGDLGECCWLHFGHNHFKRVHSSLDDEWFS